MDPLQYLRERSAALVRWAVGREPHQRAQQEQFAPNGVIRQTLDPDQALAAPWRRLDTASLAQRTFDRQGQQTTQSPGAAQFIGQIEALQRTLAGQRQAEHGRQRGGPEHGR